MKPKIVILSAFLTPFRSGAEACAEEVPLRLADRFDFTIITARLRRDLPKNDMLQGKIPVVRVGFGLPIDKWLYPFLAPREAKKINPDIVHAILETFAGEALMRCKKIVPNAKRILTLQTTNRTFRKKKIIQSPDVVTAISKHLAEIAAQMNRKSVTVIPNGIAYEAIQSACAKYSKMPGRFLYVGRLEKMKGVDLLLQSFAKIKGSFVLHIVGSGSLGNKLKKLADRLDVAHRVVFKGYMKAPDLYKEYAEAEIFCGLSRSEGMGNVFLEAQAAGCAVVATHTGGIPDIVWDRQTGILVPPKGFNAAVTALQRIVYDPVLLRSFSENGMKNTQEYDWKLIANRYADIYKSFTLAQS